MVHIWKPRNYLMPLLVIPYKEANGLIQACQIRLHANDISSDEKRYCWLSSPQERRGTSSGTPIHFTFVKDELAPSDTVLITEGALKADTVVRFRPNGHVIATSGVTCSHSELVKAGKRFQKTAITQHNERPLLNGPKGINDAVRANVRLRSLTYPENWNGEMLVFSAHAGKPSRSVSMI
jgi:hypothetical protein